MPDTYGYFYVECGDADPSSITVALGIRPSEMYRKGDRHPRIRDGYRSSGAWKLLSPLPRGEYFLDAHLTALVDILLPVASQVRPLPPEYTRGINCVGYYQRENPVTGRFKVYHFGRFKMYHP